MFNYHDLGFMGVDRAQMNRAVFRALKPGAMYVIADHPKNRSYPGVARAGGGVGRANWPTILRQM